MVKHIDKNVSLYMQFVIYLSIDICFLIDVIIQSCDYIVISVKQRYFRETFKVRGPN